MAAAPSFLGFSLRGPDLKMRDWGVRVRATAALLLAILLKAASHRAPSPQQDARDSGPACVPVVRKAKTLEGRDWSSVLKRTKLPSTSI